MVQQAHRERRLSASLLSYQDLYRHLEGKDEHGSDVIGMYAIMPDNCCAFLCTDFDDKSCEHGYKNDVLAFVGECHHVSSFTFESVLKSVSAQYVYGLTATPIRKDGHQPIIFMQCGPIRFSADAKSSLANELINELLQ